jgi:tetratricopeptide (TPR) repeat protein
MSKSLVPLLTWLVIGSLLPGQLPPPPPGKGALQTAQWLERQGNLEGARAIYQELLRKNKRNLLAYRRLKDIHKQLGEYDQALELILNHLKDYPTDLQAHVELGEIYFLKGDPNAAREVWDDFEARFGNNPGTYRILVNFYVRLGLEAELEAVVKRGRARFNDPGLLALDLANYHSARRNFDRAVDEYLNYVLAKPNQKKAVINKILLLSDEPENYRLIQDRLLANLDRDEPLIREILAAFYFKTGRYAAALDQHRRLGLETPADFTRWLNFANSLRLEGEYALATRAYETLLTRGGQRLPSEMVGKALLGLGKTFEDQIVPAEQRPTLVHYFPDNLFFDNPFYDSPELSTASIQYAFALYDSILVSLPFSTFSAEANYRLGEIQYRITRNFDGALRAYEAALRSRPSRSLEEQIRLRIGDLYLARGDISRAREYFSREQSRGIAFTLRLIRATFLAGAVDSTTALIETTLQQLRPTDPEFNDLMELRDLIQQYYLNGMDADRTAFKTYLLAEFLLRQHKLSEAVEALAFTREQFPTVALVPLVTLREALTRLTLNQVTTALELAQTLTTTPLADKGLVLIGEIHEKKQDDPRRALDYYHQILEDYPGSLLAEPVRYHLREVTERLKEG